jgi:hypothetical protein
MLTDEQLGAAFILLCVIFIGVSQALEHECVEGTHCSEICAQEEENEAQDHFRVATVRHRQTQVRWEDICAD